MRLPASHRMIDGATDAFMVLFRDPPPVIRKKAEADILRVIRHAVKTGNPDLIKSLHVGFRLARKTKEGCSADDFMELLRKQMKVRNLKKSPPEGLKSWPPTLKELKRFIDRHGGHAYSGIVIETMARAKGIPIRKKKEEKILSCSRTT